MLGGVLVVGMNLDRKVVLGVQNFNEQRELLALAVAKGAAVLGPQPRQRVTGIRASSDLAVAVGVCRDGPALTDGALGNVVAKHGLQLAAAPDLLVEDRREFNQIGHVHTPIRLCGCRVRQLKTSTHRITNLCQRYVVQLKAVAYVVRDRIFKRGAAIQEANLVEFEQGGAGFGIQALSLFLSCRDGANGTVET